MTWIRTKCWEKIRLVEEGGVWCYYMIETSWFALLYRSRMSMTGRSRMETRQVPEECWPNYGYPNDWGERPWRINLCRCELEFRGFDSDRLVLTILKPEGNSKWNTYSFIHLVVCLTTGPKPLPKRVLHIVRSRASSFEWQYPLLSLRPSNSFLRLLHCLPVTSIPSSIVPSITRCRR